MLSRKASWLAIAFVVLGALCFASTASAGERIIMKVNASWNPKTPGYEDIPTVMSIQAIKEKMEARFPGRVQVRIYWDQQLSKTFDGSVNALQNRVFHMSFIPLSAMSEFSPAAIPLSNLFIFPYPHLELVYAAYDGEVGKMLRDRIIKDAELHPIAFWDAGYRHLLNNRAPIKSMADLKGVKFRVQPNPVHLESFKLFGANPTPVAWSELFTALQQGVVDGTENPFENIFGARLYEVQKYLTLTGHAFEMGAFCMGERYYQDLPEDVRQGLEEVMAEVLVIYRQAMAAKTQQQLDFFKTKKMEVNELSADELARFRQVVEPAREISRQKSGAEYTNKIYQILADNEAAYFAKKKQ